MFRSLAAVAAAIALASPSLAQAPHGQPSHAGHAAQVTPTATAAPVKVGTLVIEQAWLRQPPAGARVAGGFLRITNTGTSADRLLSGSSPVSKRLEIHEMTMATGGVMKMRELPAGIEILPGQTVELKPGSLHLMYMDLIAQPQPGERRKTTLIFEKAGRVDIEVAVVPLTQSGPKAPPQ